MSTPTKAIPPLVGVDTYQSSISFGRCWHLGLTLDVNTYQSEYHLGRCWHLGLTLDVNTYLKENAECPTLNRLSLENIIHFCNIVFSFRPTRGKHWWQGWTVAWSVIANSVAPVDCQMIWMLFCSPSSIIFLCSQSISPSSTKWVSHLFLLSSGWDRFPPHLFG